MSAAFLKRLEAFEIFGPSRAVLEYGLIRSNAPPAESTNYIQIPPKESFPLPEPDINSPSSCISDEDFVKFQASIVYNRSSKQTTIPPKFKSAEQFIQFKESIAEKLELVSQKENLPEPLKICKFSNCVTAALPGFDYCANHLTYDHGFSDQQFLKQCCYFSPNMGERCMRVCTPNSPFCQYHKQTSRI